MASNAFSYGEYRLSWLRDKAVWLRGQGSGRERGYLYGENGRFITKCEAATARSALVAFVKRIERLSVIAETPTVGRLWELYYANREADGKQMSRFAEHWKNLAPHFAHLKPIDVTDEICKAYAAHRFETGIPSRAGSDTISNDTVYSELQRVHDCLHFHYLRNQLPGFHMAPVVWRPQRAPKREKVLTEDECRALLDNAVYVQHTKTGWPIVHGEHLKLFLILGLATGGRPGAILELTWDRVDFENGIIDLRLDGKDIDKMKHTWFKGRAVVSMGSTVRAALLAAKAKAETNYVIEYKGGPIDRIDQAFKDCVARAGLGTWVDSKRKAGNKVLCTDITPHTLRHSAASWMDEYDIDVRDIQQHLGHKDERTTKKHYIHRRVEKTKKGADVIDQKIGGLQRVK